MNRQTITTALTILIGASLGGCAAVKKLARATGNDQIANTAESIEQASEASEACERMGDPVIAVEEEIAIGQTIALNFVGTNGGVLIDDGGADSKANALNRYINQVGKNLAAQSSRPNLEWTFGVLDTGAYNAFSAPGGYVLVTRGLLETVKNEAELAGVLAHEIAHITERHALKVYTAIKVNQCKTSVVAGAAGDVAGQFVSFQGAIQTPGGFIDLNDVANLDMLMALADGVVDSITSQGYAHDDEYEADRIAAELVLNAGYTPRPFKDLIGTIPGDGGIFKHHPSNEDRQDKLAAWIEEKSSAAKADPFGSDPSSADLKTLPINGALDIVRN